MNQNNRDYFDQQVEWVLEQLPQKVRRLLIEVPLHVEDRPSKQLMQELELDHPEELCGCFAGVPFGGSSVFASGAQLPNSITIFRMGIVAESRDEWGRVRRSQLREQIRITILHELAHLHGMEDDELVAMGYG